MGGARYFVTFIDDFSRKVCLSESKGIALKSLKNLRDLYRYNQSTKSKSLARSWFSRHSIFEGPWY